MFGSFKSKAAPIVKPDRTSTSNALDSLIPANKSSLKIRPAHPLEPLPVPEVFEGSDSADWALWQHSVSSQEGHAEPYDATVPAELLPEEPRKADWTDPFEPIPKDPA